MALEAEKCRGSRRPAAEARIQANGGCLAGPQNPSKPSKAHERSDLREIDNTSWHFSGQPTLFQISPFQSLNGPIAKPKKNPHTTWARE